MFDLSALDLARIQFGFTISFHIIFPAITIGLAAYLTVLEGLWLWKKDDAYLELYHFWSRIFAVNFAMGVVSGLVMAYQFGTNWSFYSQFAGSITGPLLAYEVLTAFFLEAGFLGVMLFGWNKVGRGLHFFATAMVALGTMISATWILASNSWMQTPQGHEVIDGVVVPVDWLAVIFNPSFPYRLAHMLTAAMLATALFVGASGAWHLLRGKRQPAVRRMFSMALWMVLFTAPLQIFIGDRHGLNTLEHQPVKVMAMEGHFESYSDGAPLVLFGWPDMEAGEVKYAISIPKASSLILKHELDAPLAGLNTVPREEWPPVPIVFWTFRIMVGLGLLMLGLAIVSVVARVRHKLYDWRALHRFALAMGPAGFVAVIAGWFTTEVGRQPYTVYGLLRTADSVSPLDAPAVGASLITFIVVYFIVFGAGTAYILRLMSHAPHPGESSPDMDLRQPVRAAGITPGPAVDPQRTIGASEGRS